MPYLKPFRVDDAEMPRAMDEDLTTQVGMIEEEWALSYPKYQYFAIKKAVTESPTTADLSGETGTSKFDALYGETVDASLPNWQQPHANVNPAVRASEPSVYAPPVPLHMRVERTMREDQLKKIGFDRLRFLVATIPASMLDAAGITCTAGDRFIWNGELIEVVQWLPMGWRFNTNITLYIALNCEHARRGS